ncbi:hypothetical protein [Geofilum rubicundum]|uniref:HipA-like C-terminal domain-containing protein n=1 Tax=Geofilum rubicundum JCM 15548 TaxID=1236989 RepID=A0A0E9LZA8_9BACT|nr:hypothetical protein [Geofilum rubicundum]GAO30456.1 hypothetical protein JCM15548_12725 [Geofilum rubicundum JCM 15548]
MRTPWILVITFLKRHIKKENIDYKHEFWSEIIASEVGDLLGFNMLKYDIAYRNGEIGCLSKSMVNEGQNELTEGMSYLTGYDSNYNPEDKLSKKLYTFHFIQKALEHFDLGQYIKDILEIIVLDSIIGNGDRHQENWGIITEYNKAITDHKANTKSGKSKIFNKVQSAISRASSSKKLQKKASRFSQIYDSGSCLGRELSEEKIKIMLADETMLRAYINKGSSEIHWHGRKLSHFELVKQLQNEYSQELNSIFKRIQEHYRIQAIRDCIFNIDQKLPSELSQYELPRDRKEFISNLISLRINSILNIHK